MGQWFRIGLFRVGLALWVGLTTGPLLAADKFVAIVSSKLRPYQEALEGVQEVIGQPIEVIDLSERKFQIPDGSRVIIAIGGEAALQDYPRDIPLVYLVSPGILLDAS